MITIVIAVWNQLEYTQRCLESLFIHTDYPFELLVIDNASEANVGQFLDGLYRYMDNPLYAGSQHCRNITVVHNKVNKGFLKAANFGIKNAQGDPLLLNNDTEVTAHWLSKMVRCMESDDDIAVVNPVFNNPQPGGFFFEPPNHLTNDEVAALIDTLSERRYPDICTAVGFCMLIQRFAIEQFGLFDEIFNPGIGEESDFCMRVTEGGKRVVCADDAYVYHKGKVSFEKIDAGNKIAKRHLQIFLDRWGSTWRRDAEKFNRENPLQYLRNNVTQAV